MGAEGGGERKDWSIVILQHPSPYCSRQFLETWLFSDTCSPRLGTWDLCNVSEED